MIPAVLNEDISEPTAHSILAKRYEGLYDELAPEYEARAERLYCVTNESVSTLLAASRRGQRIALDIGCGVGLAARSLSEAGCRVTAVDVSGEMLRRSQVRCPDAHLIKGDYLSTRFRQRFDLVTAFAFIHLFPSELAKTYLAKIRSELTSTGTLLIGTTVESVDSEGFESKTDYGRDSERYRCRWTLSGFLRLLDASELEAISATTHNDAFGKTWLDVIARKR